MPVMGGIDWAISLDLKHDPALVQFGHDKLKVSGLGWVWAYTLVMAANEGRGAFHGH